MPVRPGVRYFLAGLLASDVSQVAEVREGVAGGLPGGVALVERAAQVRPGQPLDEGQALRVLVGRPGRVVAGDAAEEVIGAMQREQALRTPNKMIME